MKRQKNRTQNLNAAIVLVRVLEQLAPTEALPTANDRNYFQKIFAVNTYTFMADIPPGRN
ncbi:MAG: hypothetical protein AAF456_25150 [Planctomycetota bacterium]